MIALAALLLVTQEAAAEIGARLADQPRAVRHLAERRAMCAHFAGEEPYDAARRREIERALRRLRCDQAEADEVALRHRYARHADVIAALDAARAAADW